MHNNETIAFARSGLDIGINRNTHGEPVEYTNMVLMAFSDTVEELKALGVNTRYAEEIDAQLERG